LVVGLALTLTTAPVLSSEDEGYEGEGYEHHERDEIKIYGIIEKIPEGELGTWVVKGKEIFVEKNTKIEEEYGRAQVGAYVEVEGSYHGEKFIAHDIEVKKAK
jgi:hypothetical protein